MLGVWKLKVLGAAGASSNDTSSACTTGARALETRSPSFSTFVADEDSRSSPSSQRPDTPISVCLSPVRFVLQHHTRVPTHRLRLVENIVLSDNLAQLLTHNIGYKPCYHVRSD